jgi:hypothetical protein
LITVLFFSGPAFAAQAARQPVFGSLENSLGSIPTFAVRLCCVLFLSVWIAKLVAVPTLWALTRNPESELSSIETGMIAAGILAFLFFTGLQSTRTSAKLALFTNKLGIAILVAAFIRVHNGWASVPAGFPTAGQGPAIPRLCHSLSALASYAAPLGLLAADLTFHLPKRKQVALAGLTGAALPIFVVLSLSGVVGVATLASGFYQPSLNPNIAMALWSQAAGSAMPGRMLVAAITTFGALRFGARALAACGSALPPGKLKWFLLVGLVTVIASLSVRPYDTALATVSKITATCLTVASAVLTGDFVSGGKRGGVVRRVDLVGVAALLAGLAVAFCLPKRYLWGLDNWWLPWLLPSYAVGVVGCLLGRALQRTSAPGRVEQVPR